MALRKNYDKQLKELNQELIAMGAMCETCIGLVAKALQGESGEPEEAVQEGLKHASATLEEAKIAAEQKPGEKSPIPDLQETANAAETAQQLASKIYYTDSHIDQSERDIEALCLKLLLRQQPVASDLRLVSAALKMISDMERVGDQCADIADILRVLDTQKITALETAVDVRAMASETMKMVTKAVDSFVSMNLVVARGVIQADDVVDQLFNKVKAELIGLVAKNADEGEALLDLLMIAKYLERIGDHATNIAEWVEFAITGEHEKKTKYQFLETNPQA